MTTLLPSWRGVKGRCVSASKTPTERRRVLYFTNHAEVTVKNQLFVDHGDEPEDVLAGRKLAEELYHGYREQQRVHVRRGGLQREEKGTSHVHLY